MADTLTEVQRAEIKRLRSEHPDYAVKKFEWEFYLQAYEGGPAYVNETNLFKHQREHYEDYSDRLKRATYANYCQPLVDFVPEFIYSQGVQRQAPKPLQDAFDSFKSDVDRSGTAIDSFMMVVAEEARIFGHTWVGVDKPPRPDNIDPNEELSDARAKELGIKIPYFYHVRPLEVLDWVTDQFGNYLYLKRREIYWEQGKRRSAFRKVERFTEWQKDIVTISKIDITDDHDIRLLPKKTMPNPWTLIPFVQFFYKKSKMNKDLGVSFIADIAAQNKQVFNLTSLIDEFLYRQCFNILAMEQDTSVPTRDRTEGRVGTSNVMYVPKGVANMPAYIAPASEPAAFIQSERQSAVKEMYRQAAQDIMAEVFAGGGRGIPSGDAQKQAFARTIPMIAKMADMMQFAEISLFTMWAKMQAQTWDGGKVAYRDDYSVTNVQDLLIQLGTIFNTLKVLPPTFVREEWKRIIKEFDGKIDPDTMTKIIEEIDGLSDEELVEGYKLAEMDAKAGLGLPATANLTQGKAQRSLGTDKKITLATGSKSATKEAIPDANRRATKGKSQK